MDACDRYNFWMNGSNVDPLWQWLTTGNAPGWLAFVGAAVAALIAWRSSNASRKSARLAQRQLDRLEAQDEREHADRFAVWVKSGRRLDEGKFDRWDLLVCELIFDIANSNGQPIYDLRIYIGRSPGREWIGRAEAVPPSMAARTWKAVILTWWPITDDELPAHVVGTPRMAVGYFFRDVRGREWHRAPNGELSLAGDLVEEVDAEARKMAAASSMRVSADDPELLDSLALGFNPLR
jgi:hypothetical protein